MKILRVSLIFKNDFHTTGGQKGSIVDFLRDSKDNSYIPSTHIKGIMRTEAERLLRSTENISCFITGNPKIVLCEEVENGGYGCDICRIFGAPKKGSYKEGKIRITDFKVDNKVDVSSRTHVSIKRDTQTKSKSALFEMRSVSPGAKFSGYIFVRDILTASEEKLLYASIVSMTHYGIGKCRSRGLGGIMETPGYDGNEDGLKISEISQEEYMRMN
jgi:CRISPR/Cas system CSM-associated protein Csm3 (group 7 of RAMP superfamily)